MSIDRAHEHWSELAAAHALSALDADDEADYLRHAASCQACRQLETDLGATLAELAAVTPDAAPPPTLKAAILRAAAKDGETIAADDLTVRRGHRRSSSRRVPVWISAAAAVVAITVAVSVWTFSRPTHTSVAARCASTRCPTATLRADGKPVATVLVLDDATYVQVTGLPAAPSGHSYVLWRISAGQPPVGLAALQLKPNDDPVKAATLRVPVSSIDSFALSDEPGDTVPARPTRVVAQGTVG